MSGSSIDNNGSGASGTTGTAGVPDVVLNSTYDAMGDRLSLAASIASTADFKTRKAGQVRYC